MGMRVTARKYNEDGTATRTLWKLVKWKSAKGIETE